MRRRNYLAGTALGAVTSTSALLGGCLDSLETDGPDPSSGDEDDADTDDTGTSDADDSAGDEEGDASDDDDTNSADGEVQDGDGSEQDDEEDSEQGGDESSDRDDESEHRGEDEQTDDGTDEGEQTDGADESEGDETVEFEVIDMTPSVESGTEFTYIVLAHADGPESVPGEASLVDDTGATVDSTSYEATSGGGSFELTYQAPTVDEEIDVALTIETDHGTVNLGSVRVFPSEPAESDGSSDTAENSTENDGSDGPTENATESGD
ncbi:hypothetical protein [Natronorubrum sp. DTA7]|uniref:hypothetical protein n=1 Tax=Natronorubrum sp. DTA7 TaxID=3447016 RepID=UPI003F833082